MIKEEMIEKIREIVVLRNNPECNSLEKAFQKEFKNPYCLVRQGDVIIDNQYRLKDFTGFTNKILGLPFTLERILVAFNKNRIEEDIGLFFFTGKEIKLILVDEGYNKKLCDWKLNKTLEEQSEETIKNIFDVLCC